MLDGKILAAVLATLTAILVTTSGGNLESPEIPETGSLDVSGMLQNPGNSIRNMIFPAPEPTEKVEADIKANNLWEETVKVKQATVKVRNLTSLELGSISLNSDRNMTLNGFDGKIEPSNLTSFKGSIQGVETSGVNLSSGTKVEFSVKTPGIEVIDAESDRLKFEDAEAVIKSGGSTHDLRNRSRKVEILGFEGDMEISPLDKEVQMDGKVGVIEAGSFSLGN